MITVTRNWVIELVDPERRGFFDPQYDETLASEWVGGYIATNKSNRTLLLFVEKQLVFRNDKPAKTAYILWSFVVGGYDRVPQMVDEYEVKDNALEVAKILCARWETK